MRLPLPESTKITHRESVRQSGKDARCGLRNVLYQFESFCEDRFVTRTKSHVDGGSILFLLTTEFSHMVNGGGGISV